MDILWAMAHPAGNDITEHIEVPYVAGLSLIVHTDRILQIRFFVEHRSGARRAVRWGVAILGVCACERERGRRSPDVGQ
jgi:hypothetical protein